MPRKPAADPEPPAVWRNRIVGHGEADPDELLPNPLNWRTHPALQRASLAGVLYEVGWVQQVVVNRTTGHLIDGHLRVDMARGKGVKVPFVEVELTEDEERLVLATLDPLSALAVTDVDALKDLLSGLSSTDEALSQLLADLAGRDPLTTDDLVDGSDDYTNADIGYEVSVIVRSPDDRDAVSRAIQTAGFTPAIRSLRES